MLCIKKKSIQVSECGIKRQGVCVRVRVHVRMRLSVCILACDDNIADCNTTTHISCRPLANAFHFETY